MTAGPRGLHVQRDRAESFGATARVYDRARPGYPEQLVDDLLEGAPADALDVGCGTGKASRPLQTRGVTVLGIEPDERMAEVARDHGIAVETANFEDWDAAGRQFDLLVSGQAWHWVDPVRGPAKALEVLRPGGRLATFWNVVSLTDEVRNELDTVYESLAPEIDPYSVVRGNGLVAHQGGPVESTLPGFGPLDYRRYEWQEIYSRAAWLELIATHSDHGMMDEQKLLALLEAVGDVIDRHGGQVTGFYATYAVFGAPELT